MKLLGFFYKNPSQEITQCGLTQQEHDIAKRAVARFCHLCDRIFATPQGKKLHFRHKHPNEE